MTHAIERLLDADELAYAIREQTYGAMDGDVFDVSLTEAGRRIQAYADAKVARAVRALLVAGDGTACACFNVSQDDPETLDSMRKVLLAWDRAVLAAKSGGETE